MAKKEIRTDVPTPKEFLASMTEKAKQEKKDDSLFNRIMTYFDVITRFVILVLTCGYAVTTLWSIVMMSVEFSRKALFFGTVVLLGYPIILALFIIILYKIGNKR